MCKQDIWNIENGSEKRAELERKKEDVLYHVHATRIHGVGGSTCRYGQSYWHQLPANQTIRSGVLVCVQMSRLRRISYLLLGRFNKSRTEISSCARKTGAMQVLDTLHTSMLRSASHDIGLLMISPLLNYIARSLDLPFHTYTHTRPLTFCLPDSPLTRESTNLNTHSLVGVKLSGVLDG